MQEIHFSSWRSFHESNHEEFLSSPQPLRERCAHHESWGKRLKVSRAGTTIPDFFLLPIFTGNKHSNTKHSESSKPHLPMCVPWPLLCALGLLLLPGLLGKGAWAASSTPQGVYLPDLPVADCAAHPRPRRPGPARCWAPCGSRPSSTHQMVLRLFFVLTYLLLDSWESCESGKGKKEKTSPAANRKKNIIIIKKFPFHVLSQNTENGVKKHSELSQKGGKSREGQMWKVARYPNSVDSSGSAPSAPGTNQTPFRPV